MFYVICSILLATTCGCVKVDMQGTLSLGKDVIHTISRFFGENLAPVNSRRSLTPLSEDKITEMVKMTILCRDLDLCHGELRKFVDEYVTLLAKGIENVLTALISENFDTNSYEIHLQQYLGHIRKILKEENEKITQKNEPNVWINTMKKICAVFQELALKYVSERLLDKNNIDKKLNQKLILATVIIEMKYLHKLCVDYNICVKSNECSVGLNTVIEHLITLPDEKIRLFIKYVYEALYDTTFYTYLSETTAHEFQIILNDMAYSSNIPLKELLSAVHTIVAARLEFLSSNKDEKLSHDGLLLHVILSDMDNIYSNKSTPFGEFLSQFFSMVTRDETHSISKHIRRVCNEIGKELSLISTELLRKLSGEVRIFLEMIVDQE